MLSYHKAFDLSIVPIVWNQKFFRRFTIVAKSVDLLAFYFLGEHNMHVAKEEIWHFNFLSL